MRRPCHCPPNRQVRDLLRNKQHNSVMMAYGITAAGKTYTIEGTGEQPGVMPRALVELFEGLGSHAEPIVARASYYEVGGASGCLMVRGLVTAGWLSFDGLGECLVGAQVAAIAAHCSCALSLPLLTLSGVQRADL